MKKALLLTFVLLVSYSLVFSQTKTWTVDPAHTSVIFTVKHMVISEVSGYFREFTGKAASTNDNFDDSKAEITIKTSSINTDVEARDKHLRSADFFDVEKYPLITFKTKSFKKVDDEYYNVVGDLTLKGTTKEITLKAKLNGVIQDPYGNIRSGWKAITSINRFDYGLNWNNVLETGGLVVGKDVAILINAEFIQNK
jgi:polyisoprenoid-binding protein YceI